MNLLLFFLAGALSASPTARLEVGKGTVHLMRAGSSVWLPIETNTEVLQGDKLRTYADTKAILILADSSTVELHPWSLLQIDSLDSQGQNFRLDMGSVRSRVAKFMRRFQVATPVSVCAARGTDYNVAVDPDQQGKTSVSVAEGKVSVKDDKGGEVLLAKGDSVIVLAEGLQTPARSSPSEESESPPRRRRLFYSVMGAFVFIAVALVAI